MAILLQKITCNDRHILKSNEVQIHGEKDTVLQIKSTPALEYFISLKIS